MVDSPSNTDYIPANKQYQKLLRSLDSKSGSQKNILTEEQCKQVKIAWYEDQLYSLCLLIAYNNQIKASESNLDPLVPLFAKQINSEDRSKIIYTTAISVANKLIEQPGKPINIKHLETVLLNKIEQTFHFKQSQQDADLSSALWQDIVDNWKIAYSIFTAFKVSPIYNGNIVMDNHKTSGPAMQKDSTTDRETLEGIGNSPPSTPEHKRPPSSRQSSAMRHNSNSHMQSLQEKIDTLQAEKDLAIRSLRQALCKLEHELHRTTHTLKTTESKLDTAYKTVDEISQREHDTKTELADRKRKHTQLAQQATQISKEFASLQEAYNATSSEVQTLKTSKRTLSAQLQKLTSDNQELKNNAALMQQEVEHYWRIAESKDAKDLAEFLRQQPDFNTLIAVLKGYQEKIISLHKDKELLFQNQSILQDKIQKAIDNIQANENKMAEIATEIVTLEEKGANKPNIAALTQKYHTCDQSLQEAQEECSKLRNDAQVNNHNITHHTAEMQTLRLAMQALYAEAQSIDSDAVQALELSQIMEDHTSVKSLAILQKTTQWLIQYIPYLSWSFSNYLFILLQEHCQHVDLSFDEDLRNNMTDITAKLYKASDDIPLISQAWISRTMIHSKNSQAAYIPYDFYQNSSAQQTLQFQKNLTLEVQSLGEKSLQLDLFYTGAKHIKIEQLKEEIFAFTSLLVTHAETYPNLEIEMEVHNDYAQVIFDNLKAYQVLDTSQSLRSEEKTVKLKLNKNSQFDLHRMIDKVPLPKAALLDFSQLPLQPYTLGNTIS